MKRRGFLSLAAAPAILPLMGLVKKSRVDELQLVRARLLSFLENKLSHRIPWLTSKGYECQIVVDLDEHGWTLKSAATPFIYTGLMTHYFDRFNRVTVFAPLSTSEAKLFEVFAPMLYEPFDLAYECEINFLYKRYLEIINQSKMKCIANRKLVTGGNG